MISNIARLTRKLFVLDYHASKLGLYSFWKKQILANKFMIYPCFDSVWNYKSIDHIYILQTACNIMYVYII